MAAYYKRLTPDDAGSSFRRPPWTAWEMATSRRFQTMVPRRAEDLLLPKLSHVSSVTTHEPYFHGRGHNLKNIDAIRHIPGVIVQGDTPFVHPSVRGNSTRQSELTMWQMLVIQWVSPIAAALITTDRFADL